jgi:hypothetical protein
MCSYGLNSPSGACYLVCRYACMRETGQIDDYGDYMFALTPHVAFILGLQVCPHA